MRQFRLPQFDSELQVAHATQVLQLTPVSYINAIRRAEPWFGRLLKEYSLAYKAARAERTCPELRTFPAFQIAPAATMLPSAD